MLILTADLQGRKVVVSISFIFLILYQGKELFRISCQPTKHVYVSLPDLWEHTMISLVRQTDRTNKNYDLLFCSPLGLTWATEITGACDWVHLGWDFPGQEGELFLPEFSSFPGFFLLPLSLGLPLLCPQSNAALISETHGSCHARINGKLFFDKHLLISRFKNNGFHQFCEEKDKTNTCKPETQKPQFSVQNKRQKPYLEQLLLFGRKTSQTLPLALFLQKDKGTDMSIPSKQQNIIKFILGGPFCDSFSLPVQQWSHPPSFRHHHRHRKACWKDQNCSALVLKFALPTKWLDHNLYIYPPG